MAPIITQLEQQKIPYKILHTGQHYTPDLAGIYKELGIRDPDWHLEGMDKLTTHGTKTAHILSASEALFQAINPRLVLVHGDTDHALACALAARKLHIEIGHVEAGLRSRDWRQPEEHNRVMIDHISEYLFAPTLQSVMHLAEEHVGGAVYLTGNTICDVIPRFLPLNKLSPLKPYILLTVHREENIEDPKVLRKIVEAIWVLKEELGMRIIFPIHPHTRAKLTEKEWLPGLEKDVALVPPMGYSDFLKTLSNAKIVLTDSGGVQEEACILHVPCVVLREYTDRPEAIQVGAAMVAGTNPDRILECAKVMIEAPTNWINAFNPYDDANCSGRIASILSTLIRKKALT